MPIVDVGRIIGNKPENNEPIIKTPRQTGVDIYNETGEKVGNVPYGKNGIIGAGETVYQGKDSEGNVTYSTDPYRLTSYISFDDNTGKITMHAPQSFFDSEVYSQYFDDDKIAGLSKLYAQNKDAKLEMADGSQKTVKEIIDIWNNDLPQLVKMQQDYARMGESVEKRLGENAAKKFNLKTYQIMGQSAYSGRKDDYLTIPKSIINDPKWSFFKDLPGFDNSKLVITKGDFADGYYHLDASRDIASDSKTSISRLKKDVANALANFEGDDVEEFARLVAFNNFLNDQSAEGASNAPDGAVYDKLIIGSAAVSEAAARNTAKWVVDTAEWASGIVNAISTVLLAPFSLVDLVATGEWNSKRIIDETVGTAKDIIGVDLTPGADSIAEFLENESARRSEIFALTDATTGLLYNLAGGATYVTENVLGTIALNRLLVNSATLAIAGRSVKKAIPDVVQNLNKLRLTDAAGNIVRTNEALTIEAAKNIMTESGVSQAAADLLTTPGNFSLWQKINLIGSLDPADLIAGAAQWNNFVSKAGVLLKSGAFSEFAKFEEEYRRAASAAETWQTIAQLEAKYTKTKKTLASVYTAGRELFLTSAKMLTTLDKFAKYVPPLYYASHVIVGTAIAEADTFRQLMDGVDNDEERSQLWSMVGRTALGWTIGMVAGSIVNKVFSGSFDAAAEYANAGATEKVAKGVTIISGRVNQLYELAAGKSWVDKIKSPVRKAAIKYNQALQKSQEYLANAADAVRMSGGSEVEARAATITAIEQMKENQNAIDFAQNPQYLVNAWSSEANPAYFAATLDFTGLEAQSSKMLTDLGFNQDVQTTALIGGVASNGTDSQDVVNYKARALQRAGVLRDDYDYSMALVEFNKNIASADITSMYMLKTPEFIREREIAKRVMAEFESKYPKVYTDFIKNEWAPAALRMSYQFRQIEQENGYYLKSREEGWKSTGMFGANNELWFPLQRVTDAQKDFEEAARNPLEIIKKGAVKRKYHDPEHYSPGSDEMTDFVHPMITWKMYEYQRAVAIAFNDLATANFMNPYVKNVTKLDGSQVGAVKTYNDLKPSYSKAVIRAMDSFKKDLDKAGIVNDFLDKQKMETKIRNAKKAVDKAKETWQNIPDIDVSLTKADKSRTIDTLPEEKIDELLDKGQIKFKQEVMSIQKDYRVKTGSEGLAQRERIAEIDTELKRIDTLADQYRNGLNWGKLDTTGKKSNSKMEELKEMHTTAGKNAAKELRYRGDGSNFDEWIERKKAKLDSEKTKLRGQVEELRGAERPGVEFRETLYSDEEVPKEYIQNRRTRQEISDKILGVWNGYNGGLAYEWLNDADASVKEDLRNVIESNPELRAALLSTMYDNSGSDLPYDEWLETPIVLKRQQVMDSLRDEDAFLSFSMQKDWIGIGGLIPRLPTEPGDIITLSVKPRDTLGEIPKGVEAEDELEVIVPREVYATAMTYAGKTPADIALKNLELKRKALKRAIKERCE